MVVAVAVVAVAVVAALAAVVARQWLHVPVVVD